MVVPSLGETGVLNTNHSVVLNQQLAELLDIYMWFVLKSVRETLSVLFIEGPSEVQTGQRDSDQTSNER
jgi:hypothetical protein